MPDLTRRQALIAVSAAAAGGAVVVLRRKTSQLIRGKGTVPVPVLDALTSSPLLLPPAGSAWFGAYPGPGNVTSQGCLVS